MNSTTEVLLMHKQNLALSGLTAMLDDDLETSYKLAVALEGVILLMDLTELDVIRELEWICMKCGTLQITSAPHPMPLSLFEDHDCNWILNIPSMMDEYGITEKAQEILEGRILTDA